MLWESWRALLQRSQAASGPPVSTLDSFVTCLTAMNLPALSQPVRSRLTGGFEVFVRDVLGAQVTTGANLFHSPTPLFWTDLLDGAAERQTKLVHPDRRIVVQDLRGGPSVDLPASDSRLPDRVFIRSDLWEPESFAPLEAFLRSKDRCLFVLHERTLSVGWLAWLQSMANRGSACVFAGCDRLKVRVYLQRSNGSESWAWYKGLWELWAVRLDGQGFGGGVDLLQFPFACRGIFGRLKRWDPNAFWSSLSLESLPPNFLPSSISSEADDGRGGDVCQTLDSHVSRKDPVSSRSIGQVAEEGGGPGDAPSAWRKVQNFWADWDKEAQKRSFLCAQNPIDWEAVELSLRRSNSLLATSPDARLRRISTLAKLPADTPLSTDHIVIYAMLALM
jgi:hypothetical protein